MNKEKTPVLMFYFNGDDGSIGVEFGSDFNSTKIRQQTIGALEIFLGMMKKEAMEDIIESKDENDRTFTL